MIFRHKKTATCLTDILLILNHFIHTCAQGLRDPSFLYILIPKSQIFFGMSRPGKATHLSRL